MTASYTNLDEQEMTVQGKMAKKLNPTTRKRTGCLSGWPARLTLLLCILLMFPHSAQAGQPQQTVFFGDEFDTGTLSEGWQWIDPGNDCSYDLQREPGWLWVSAPKGGNDLFPSFNYDAPRLLRPVTGNFVAITHVRINPTQDYQGAGILVWQDGNNQLRLERGYGGVNGGKSGIRLDRELQGNYSAISPNFRNPVLQTDVYLRMARVGNRFYASYSFDGQTWLHFANTTLDVSETVYVGIAVINQPGPGIEVAFDFFHLEFPTIIRVVDENNQPVGEAQVYLNQRLAGVSDPDDGTLALTTLKPGDFLAAKKLIQEVDTDKNFHNDGSGSNWAYRVYATSVRIEANAGGRPVLTPVDINKTEQIIQIRSENVLVGFNIVASLEWDADPEYLANLVEAFRHASNYLYDASDGQMLFEQVNIYENTQYFEEADYRFFSSPAIHPVTECATADKNALGPMRWGGECFIQVGKAKPAYSQKVFGKEFLFGEVKWTDAYPTLIHEFGHYGLGLYDEYLHYNAQTDSYTPLSENLHCTQKLHNTNAPTTAASLMTNEYEATEFCSNLSSDPHYNAPAQTSRSAQSIINDNESAWQTIARRFNEQEWKLITPDQRGYVLTGPEQVPIQDWNTVSVHDVSCENACTNNPVYTFVYPANSPKANQPVQQAPVFLYCYRPTTPSGNLIFVGNTNADGQIVLTGGCKGDRGYIFDWTTQEQYAAVFPYLCEKKVQSSKVSRSILAKTSPKKQETIEIVLQKLPVELKWSVAPAASKQPVFQLQSGQLSERNTLSWQVYLNGSHRPQKPAQISQDKTKGSYQIKLSNNTQAYNGILELTINDSEGKTYVLAVNFALGWLRTNQQKMLEPFLKMPNGQAGLTIPAQKESTQDWVALSTTPPPGKPPTGWTQVGNVYAVTGSAENGLPPNTMLSLSYSEVIYSNANLQKVQMYFWNSPLRRWEKLETELNEHDLLASTTVQKYGLYAMMGSQNTQSLISGWLNEPALPIILLLLFSSSAAILCILLLLMWRNRQIKKRVVHQTIHQPAGKKMTATIHQPTGTSPHKLSFPLAASAAASIHQPSNPTENEDKMNQPRTANDLQISQLLSQAKNQMEAQDYAAAKETLQQVLKIDNNSAQAWFSIGLVLIKLHDRRNALHCLEQAQHLGHPQADKALEWLNQKSLKAAPATSQASTPVQVIQPNNEVRQPIRPPAPVQPPAPIPSPAPRYSPQISVPKETPVPTIPAQSAKPPSSFSSAPQTSSVSPQQIAIWIEQLGSSDDVVSEQAAGQLASNGPDAVNQLIETLEGSDGILDKDKKSKDKRKKQASKVLVKIGAAAIPALLKGLEYRSKNIPTTCAGILLVIGQPAVAPLAAYLHAVPQSQASWSMADIALSKIAGAPSLLEMTELRKKGRMAVWFFIVPFVIVWVIGLFSGQNMGFTDILTVSLIIAYAAWAIFWGRFGGWLGIIISAVIAPFMAIGHFIKRRNGEAKRRVFEDTYLQGM